MVTELKMNSLIPSQNGPNLEWQDSSTNAYVFNLEKLDYKWSQA